MDSGNVFFYPKTVPRPYKVYAPAYAARKRLILIQIAYLSTENGSC